MKRRSFVKLSLLGAVLGKTVGRAPLTAAAQPSRTNLDGIVGTWAEDLDNLSSEERLFLQELAEDRQKAIGTRSGLFETPGKNSEIVQQPILYDLLADPALDKSTLDSQLRMLVEQAGDRFYYFETGVTIDRGRWESIDALIFEMRYTPNQVSTYSQTPDYESRSVLKLGTEANLEISGALKVRPVKLDVRAVEAKGEAQAAGRVQFNFERKFNLLEEVLVSAIGEKQPWCRWTLNSGRLGRNDDVRFVTVLRVPKGTESLSIQVTATFIDKLFKTLELSRATKEAAYNCTFEPLVCTYLA